RLSRVIAERWRTRPAVSVVHSLGTHGLLGALLPRAHRTIVVPWGSEVEAATRSVVRHRAAAFVLRQADLVLATSRAMARTIAQGWPAISVDTAVRSWGVAQAALAERGDGVRAAVRARLGLSEEHLIVLAPRGLGAVYRHDEVRRAFVAAQATRTQLRLVEIDTAADDRSRSVQCRAGATVTLSRQPHDQLLDLFAAADAVVSVPRADQRSTTVVEAIASGVPVLLADVPAYRELAEDGAAVTLLGEPVLESLTAALAAPGTVGARIGGNRHWAREVEDRDSLFDAIVRLCTGASR
ncbi:glycosyltransferase, partial [Pseudactinotalea suaedae]